ncbi:MAG: RnfABCDGE type electron transport complex subunit D [Candidatus Lernaella stagnicola]|nr:RnfABCDGE type electron transport complex subunit D [Candidatus Lernaella stagnicola]
MADQTQPAPETRPTFLGFTKPKRGWIQIQKPMIGTTLALAPAALWGIYSFGWRVLAMLALSFALSILTEGLFTWRQGKPVTSSVFVTATLFALILPPSLPLWMAAVGIVFAVVFGKMVFGGFGNNAFNPAMVGRAFLYITFPVQMTARWNAATDAFPRGLDNWLVDTFTGATPLVAVEQGQAFDYVDAALGFIPGSAGEISFVLVAAGGAYVMLRKWAAWQSVLATALFAVGLQTAFYFTGNLGINSETPVNPLYMVLTGGFALGLFFMVTDPVSSANTNIGRWVYGAIIGISTVVIRTFGQFAEGFMFAVLLGNTFAPIIDYTVRERQRAKKAAAKAKADAAKGATP